MKVLHQQQAFTFIEVLIVIAIFGVLAVVVLPQWSEYRNATAVKTATEIIAAETNSIRSAATAGIAGQSHGLIATTTSSYATFSGAAYVAGDVGNRYTAMPETVSFDLMTSEGDDEIVFSRLTGFTAETATMTISNRNDASVYKTIVIDPDGTINVR